MTTIRSPQRGNGFVARFPDYLPDRVQQNQVEWQWLLGKITGLESFLEVGSCLGYSLRDLAFHAVKGAKLRSIDLGEVGPPTARFSTGRYLQETIDTLRGMGYDVSVLLEDSHSPIAVKWAEEQGPYDFVYIDGDHSLEGVMADWANYGHLGKIVGFHDINHDGHGVKRFWQALKAEGWRTEEKITSHQGTGLVYLETGLTSSPEKHDGRRPLL